MTTDLISAAESERFLDQVQILSSLKPEDLFMLNVQIDSENLPCSVRDARGIF